MSEHIEEEIAVSGSLFSVSLFEEKLMKNFLLISNKLRRLEGLFQLEQKVKSTQKQLKFLTMKVQTIVQKMPKDSGSLNKNDVKMMIKDGIFDLLNSSDQRLFKSKYHQDVLQEINKMKEEVSKISMKEIGKKDKKDGPKTSFTAGQILRENDKQGINGAKISKESLMDVLDDKQMEIVNDIIENKDQQNELNQFGQINQKIQNLTKIVEQLRLGRGYAHFLERQNEKFQKFEQYEQKSRNTTRKEKEKPIKLQGVRQQNVKGELMKLDLLNQVQRMELNKQQIIKSELNQRKSVYSNLFPNVKETKMIRQINLKDKEKDSVLKDGTGLQKQGFRRTQSIKKIDRGDKRLKVDDIKDINSVLRQIQLRIQTKVSHDIFMGFVKDIEQKIQVLRLQKDSTSDINEIRKNLYVLQSKMQSVVSYLQSLSQEDQALIVKKQWTCVSCDKGLEKYQGKIGQHLNWQNISGKKISPTKVGAFGQTGLLAAKIRNLIDGGQDQ